MLTWMQMLQQPPVLLLLLMLVTIRTKDPTPAQLQQQWQQA
jgi:hypothetical protein